MTSSEYPLHADYADIVAEDADPDLLHTIYKLDKALRTAYSAEVPLQLRDSLRQVLEEHLSRRPALGPGHRKNLATTGLRRFSILAGALALILVLGGAAYQQISGLDAAFRMNPGTEQIVLQNLGTDMDLSQTVKGYTVTVKRVYADMNEIVIGCVVSGPPQLRFHNFILWGEGFHTPTLTDNQGNVFSAAPLSWGHGVENGRTGAYLELFQGETIKPNTKALKLHFQIQSVEAIQDIGLVPELKSYRVPGPFVFDFTVPMARARVINAQQSVAVGGTTVTVERVATSPTGTRVYLRGAGPSAHVELSVDGSHYTLDPPGARPFQWSRDSVWDYATDESLLDKHGEWTLTVKAGQYVPAGIKPSPNLLQGGPWSFHFAVP